MGSVSRSVRRPGYGTLVGAQNPKITVSATAPSFPKDKELWFDISTAPAVWKWWDAANSIWKE